MVIALAAFTGPTIVRVMQQKDPVISMPSQVGELRRDDSDLAKEHAGDLVAILRAQIAGLDNSGGAVYTVPSGDATRSVMLVAGATVLWNPEAELDAVLGFVSESSEDPLKELKEVDAGPLGGVMKCGTTQMDASPMAVCGWADHGSIALALFPARSTDEAAGLMRDLRAASVKR